MGGDVVGVVSPTAHPVAGPLPSISRVVNVAVELRRALVVLVVLGEVVLLVVRGGGG